MKAKNKNIRHTEKEGYQDLYVCMYNAKEKRKHLLTGIKNSLVMQEEFEKLTQVRKDKAKVISVIKKSIEDLNKSYQLLKKELPNVKNVISYTEKEIGELEQQINMLKNEEKIILRDIKLDENIDEYLKDTKNSLKEFNLEKHEKEVKKEERLKKLETAPKNLTKLDRIKNNLKVIESKLKEI